MKKNILFISGSPRNGNTDYIITKLYNSFDGKKDVIYLRKQQVDYCNGCLSCSKTKDCTIDDDMKNINRILIKADILVIGSPNYYDNVPGILKSFIDRTNPLFHSKKLKGKKIFFIITGGGRLSHTKRVAKTSLKYFAETHNMDIIGEYYFKALKRKELSDNHKTEKDIIKILHKINL